MGLEVREGSVDGGGVLEAEVDEEDVLPGASVDGAGLYFGQIEPGGGEGGEGAEEGSGAVVKREGDAEFVGGDGSRGRGGDEGQKAGVIVGMVLNPGDKDMGVILSSGQCGGDTGGVAKVLLHDVLDAAGGVVERDGGDAGMGAEPASALRERDWVGEDLADVGERDAGGGNDVVPDAEEEFAGDDEIVG